MIGSDFATMGIGDIQSGLAAREFSARELARASLDRIEERDGRVHAFLEVTEQLALSAAARIDEAVKAGALEQMGPLAGVPVAFKDNMNL